MHASALHPSLVCVHLQESVRAKVRTALGKTLPQELAVRLETSQTNEWRSVADEHNSDAWLEQALEH